MSFRDLKSEQSSSLSQAGFAPFGVDHAPLRPSQARNAIAASGISANSRIDTLRGKVAARDLREGDQVKIYGDKFATLRWVGLSRQGDNSDLPMRRVETDGSPSTTLLSPDNLVMVRHPRTELLFGTNEVLCPARFLADAGLFVQDDTVTPVFVHLLFETYELIKCGEDWVESLMPNMSHIRSADLGVAKEITAVLPRLETEQGLASYVRNRPVLNAREALVLFS